MHILGISLGSPSGNSEILLKAALQSASTVSPNATTSLIILSTLSLPTTPLPKTPSPPGQLDDRSFLLSAILEADALIISSPIYSRQPPGIWKAFTDSTMGPFIDAVFVANAIQIKKEAKERGGDFIPGWTPDERVLKPRVVGLIAQGGAINSEWGTLALPGLQQSVFSLHAKVVDQVLIRGQGFPGSVLIEGSDALPLAQRVGRNVASQVGKRFDDAQYLGEKGACNYCNLSLIELVGNNNVECGVCGAKGKLRIDDEGDVKTVFEENSGSSVVTWKGKEAHMFEIQDVARTLGPLIASVQRRKEEFKKMKFGKLSSRGKSSNL